MIIKKPSRRRRWVLALSAAVLALAAGFGLFFASVAWWLDCADPPEKADIIVVLAASYTRYLYGGDLYARGLAQQVWISQAPPDQGEDQVRGLGIKIPSVSEISRAILLKKGVPDNAIRPYGSLVNSTLDEARALAREFDGRGKKVIVVTSRYHARRARMMFRRSLPGARIIVCPTPYETFERRWWRHKDLALNSITEMFKVGYYLSGLRFVTYP